MMKIKLTNQEMMDLLQVKRNGLNAIKHRGQLETRLLKIGYKLIQELKEGRNIFYELEENVNTTTLKTCCKFTKDNYNVRSDKFPKYYLNTIDSCINNYNKSANQRAIESDTKRKNVDNWDRKLEEKNILVNKRYVYYLVCHRMKFRTEISKENYSDIDLLIRQLKNQTTDYSIYGKGKDPDMWRKKEKVYRGLERTLIDKINNCLRETGNIKHIINSFWETSKDRTEALNKLYYYNVTKIRVYDVNNKNNLHKASMALYSKVVK